jgi:membrane associated rhomboid family serine protease
MHVAAFAFTRIGSGRGGGVAFFAHVGGFVFGFLVASVLANSGRLNLRSDDPRELRAPA